MWPFINNSDSDSDIKATKVPFPHQYIRLYDTFGQEGNEKHNHCGKGVTLMGLLLNMSELQILSRSELKVVCVCLWVLHVKQSAPITTRHSPTHVTTSDTCPISALLALFTPTPFQLQSARAFLYFSEVRNGFAYTTRVSIA